MAISALGVKVFVRPSYGRVFKWFSCEDSFGVTCSWLSLSPCCPSVTVMGHQSSGYIPQIFRLFWSVLGGSRTRVPGTVLHVSCSQGVVKK